MKYFIYHNFVKYYAFIFIFELIIKFVNSDNEEDCSYKINIATSPTECVGHCPDNTCEVGDYCYAPTNSLVTKISDTPFLICKCNNKKQKVTIGNRDVYKCSDEGYICPRKYYNSDIGECVNGCGNHRTFIIWDSNGEIKEYRCSSRCLETEFIYEKNNSCLESCPYYEYERYDGTKECLYECNKGDFYVDDSNNKKCVSECDNDEYIGYDYKMVNDNNVLVKQCLTQDTIKEEYYKYNEIYVKSCSYTKILFNITTYTDITSTSTEKGKCYEDCSLINDEYYIQEDICVSNCDKSQGYTFYYNKQCLKNCNTENKKHDYNMDFKIYNNKQIIEDTITLQSEKENKINYKINIDEFPKDNICLEKCPDGTFIEEDSKTCYISSCKYSDYIHSNFVCNNSCSHYIFNEINLIEIKNTESSPSSNIYNITRKYCLSSCPVSSPYYNIKENEDAKECFKTSCKEREKYSPYNNPHACYDSCDKIEGGGYIYQKDYICYNYSDSLSCPNYYYKKTNLVQCATLQQCIEKGFNYIKGKECVDECDGYKVERIVDNDGQIQEIGKCFSEAKDCENVGYKFITENKTCLKSCDDYKTSEESPISVNGTNCFTTCPSNYPYKDIVSGKKFCLMLCKKYFYKNECKDVCESGTYYFDNNFECFDDCVIGDISYYKTEDENDNKCYYSCPENYPYIHIRDDLNGKKQSIICENPCKEKIFYYNDDKICLDKCDIYKSLNPNDNECLRECPSNQYVKENNGDSESDRKFYCTSDGGDEPYVQKKTITVNGKNIVVEKWVSNCDSSFHLISKNTKHCLEECTFPERFENDGYCIDQCPEEKIPNEITGKCDNPATQCTGDFKYYEKDEETQYYRCKKSCYPKYGMPEGGKCLENLEDCPSTNNYITYNHLCLTEPNEIYGLYYKKIDDSNDKYELLNNCGENLFIDGEYECLNENQCPGGYFEIDKVCYKNCDKIALKPFKIEDNGETLCVESCNEDKPNYGNDKICKKGCDEIDDGNIINWDNRCVSYCPHPYYRYLQKGRCVNNCNESIYIIEDEYNCLEICPDSHNYIVDGYICTKKCESYQYAQKKEVVKVSETYNYTLYDCVESCDENLYYYTSGSVYIQKKCFDYCLENEFVIQDTHICVSQCDNSKYKSYYSENTDVNPSYPNNTCVLVCPSDKPYIYLDKCVKECPSYYKYHIEGTFTCLLECPSEYKIDDEDQFTCKTYCPNGKFLDSNRKNCIDDCSQNSISGYNMYVKGAYQCRKDCDGYLIENETVCVKECSEGFFLDLSDNKCKTSCPEGKEYVNISTNPICLENCPDGFQYYEVISDIKYCKSQCNNVSTLYGQCLDHCNSDYKYYDYKNNTCLSDKCPIYSVEIPLNDTDIQYRCFDKCPSSHPYLTDDNLCSSSCTNPKYLNISANKCQNECNSDFVFIDGEIQYCLETCQYLGLFELDKNTCVKSCYDSTGYIANMDNKKCECSKYYYYDDDKKKECIDEKTNLYTILLYGTYQYLKNCDDYPFYDDNYCYETEEQIPANTKEVDRKLECVDKYYEENSIKVCLPENEPCPSKYNYLIPDKKQCVENCGSDYETFGSYCLNTNCKDKVFYFEDETETNYKCESNECSTENHKYLIEDSGQCVDDCSKTDYYILYGNKCYKTCDKIKNTIVKKFKGVNGNEYYTCACASGLWHRDEDEKILCNEENKNTCIEFIESKPKLVQDTDECLGECPSGYYEYKNVCYKDCKDVKKNHEYSMENDGNTCKCSNLWKLDVDGYKICLEGEVCNEDEKKILVKETNECVSTCSNIEYNNTCYQTCPDNTQSYTNTNNENTCICIHKWYKYEDKSLKKEIIKCFEDENKGCPNDFPYLDYETKECLANLEICNDKKIFNNICYGECPTDLKTISKEGSQNCECDISKGKWQKYSKDNMIVYECGLSICPTEKKYLDMDTKECLYACGNKYHYEGGCYLSCPENTVLVDEISKECVYIINFDNPKDLTSLDDKVKNNIQEIYQKTSKGGLVYNINNSTLQIYGVNKDKNDNQDLVMRNNLTYIDLSNCMKNIYEKNSLSDDTDLIIIKYDIGDKTDSSMINPVEYKILNSKTGEEISLDVCEDKSIVISYPLSDILNSFVTEKNLRSLEETNDKNNLNLNLREKFLKGKELYLEDNKIDSFDINNKIYIDMCYSFKLNGKDLILEDRFNYLYPLFSFCESNCIYDKIDFLNERAYCNCSAKDSLNFDRNAELLDNKVDVKEVKKNQKGIIIKCLSKISDTSKNFGFFYGLIIFLVEIAMILLTIFYSYKVFMMRIKKKFDINNDKSSNNDNINNNIVTENIENISIKGKNKNEEIIKTTERHLESENPPKRKNKDIEEDKKKETSKKHTKKEKNEKDPEVINIKKNKKNSTKNIYDLKEEKISSTKSYNLYNDKSSSNNISVKELDDDDNIFDLIKLEQKVLTIDYDMAIQKNKTDIIIMILAEILDKIYIFKAIFFLSKYEIFSIYFSLYLLWHMLVLSFICLFYNNNTLHKIWIKNNYPNLSFHLTFGFISCIISFIIYKGLYILINNNKKIKEIESIPKENKSVINEQYKKMMYWHQIKLIIFYAIEFILVIFFTLYLTGFCGIYIATKTKLVESYGIALIEVVIIKILYGLVLGILRKVSLVYKINILYKIVKYLDLYVS